MTGHGETSKSGTEAATATSMPDTRTTCIVRDLREHMPELEARYKVRSLGIFGSYVRGDQTEGSDLDILVEFHEAPSFFDFVRLEEHIGTLLGVDVDLVMRDALRPRIGGRILEELVPV